MHLFIGPKNGVNEATPTIQKKTHGNLLKNAIDLTGQPTKSWHVAQTKKKNWLEPQSYALNPNNVFGQPLDERATNGIGTVKITSHVRPNGSSMSLEPKVQVDRLSKGVVHRQSTWTIRITPCVNKRVIHAQSAWMTIWHLEILKCRFTHVCGRFEPQNLGEVTKAIFITTNSS